MARTLADLGLTPARAWALHQYVAVHNDAVNMWTVCRGLESGAVRVLHESFALLVVFVASDLTEENGQTTGDYTDAVIALVPPENEQAETVRFSSDWRVIGYVTDGAFVDALAALAEDYPDPLPHAVRGAA